MPFIRITCNKAISLESKKNIEKQLGKAITTIGKSEHWLMVKIDDSFSESMSFQGTNDPCAIVEISSYGRINQSYFDPMTSKVTQIIEAETNIPADRVYVNYREVDHWGLGGDNF